MRMISPTILDHRHYRFDELQLSTLDFYDTVGKALENAAYPNVVHYPITEAEAGLFSGRRRYLKVALGNYEFMLCAAPYGKSYFISWWLRQCPGIEVMLKLIPFIGKRLYLASLRQTYYEIDTEIMFRESVKAIVDDAIAGLHQDKGFRELALNDTITV